MSERDPLGAGLVVDEDCVSLAEGASPGVLTGEPHVGPFEHDRTEGDRFTERPVHLAVCHHLRARCSNCLASFGWRWKPSGTRVAPAARSSTTFSRSRSQHRPRVASLGGTGSVVALGGAAWRVSSSAACSFAAKSSRADSASSIVMSPRLTSTSV